MTPSQAYAQWKQWGADPWESESQSIQKFSQQFGLDPEDEDELIKAYLSEKFKISINKSPIKWDYLGKEFEKDIVYFYLEINAVAATISHIKVTNNVLLEEFDDQQNIIRLSLNDKKKTFVLKNNDSTKELDF